MRHPQYPARSLPLHAALALALTAVALAAPVAADNVYVIDADASEVHFELGATGHDVHGQFFVQPGEIHLDPATGTASGQVAIDATRAVSGNNSRDKTMRGKVLHADEHPLISFRPERFTGTLPDPAAGPAEAEIVLHGIISLVGMERAVDLPATVSFDGPKFTAHAELSVPFVDWGLHDPSMLFLRVDKVVKVSIDAVGLATGAAMAADAPTDTAPADTAPATTANPPTASGGSR